MFALPKQKCLQILVPLRYILHLLPTSKGTDFAAYNYFIFCYTVPPVLYALLYPYQTKFSDTKPFIFKIKNAMQLKNLSWNILSNFWPTLINEFVASSPTVWWVRNYFYKIIFSVPAFFFFLLVKMLLVEIRWHRLLLPVSPKRLKTSFPTYRNVTVLWTMSSANDREVLILF